MSLQISQAPPADVESLKGHLRTQLEGLLQDDSFMNILTLEYLRQRKAASQQKQRPSPTQTPAQPPAPAQQVPPHLLSLLQQPPPQ